LEKKNTWRERKRKIENARYERRKEKAKPSIRFHHLLLKIHFQNAR